MNTEPMPEDDMPKAWRAYSTPTRSAAKVLEEIVARQGSSVSTTASPASSLSSHSSSRSARAASKAIHSELPPLPPYPPVPINPPDPGSTPFHHPSDKPLPAHPKRGASPNSHSQSMSQESHASLTETPPTSLKPKHASKSLPRRVAEELKDHRHRHSTPIRDATPPPSHSGRHRYAGSHSRSSSDSISVIMMMSRERLARETARANEAERRAADAERQAAEVMSLFKSTHEAKLVLERDLHKAREELGLYKVQLETAQKEIFRAQEIVDRVERQRVEAQDELSRNKEKVRRLSQTLAVEHALEEGRRAGFDEGLKQGRVYQQATSASWDDIYDISSRKRRSTQPEADRASEVSSYSYPGEGSSSGSSSASRSKAEPQRKESESSKKRESAARPSVPPSTSRVRRDSVTTATQSMNPIVSTYNPYPRTDSSTPGPSVSHRNYAEAANQRHVPANASHKKPPDVARYPDALPIRTVTTPVPVRVPSTQPPVPEPMPPHQAPEAIRVMPSDGPIHPVPVYNHSPSVVHQSIVLPPDNYIPVMNANSVIALPPPHELTIPVAAEAPPINPAVSQAPPSMRGAESRFRTTNADRPRYKDTNDAESVAHTTRTGRDTEKYGRTTSVRSVGSTHLSELDMLAPPRSYEFERSKAGSRGPEPEPILRSRPRASTNPHVDGAADRWPEARRDPPRAVSPAPYKIRDTATAPTTGRDSRNQIERPRTAEPPSFSRPGSSVAMRTNGFTTRRPREVVLTMPLGDPFDDPTTAHGHSSFPPRSATPANPTYGRPRLDTGDHSSKERPSSTATIPEIDVETPTTTHQSAPSNRTTVVDPILLTPESANRPLPHPHTHTENSGLRIFTSEHGGERIEARLPDDNLPPGFQPLSPIPGMENLNPYPPGFAPSVPRNHPSGAVANFTYASPLIRPVA